MSEPAPPSVLLIDRPESGIAVLTLNRPSAMNALSRELRRAVVGTLAELAADESIGVVILTGAGRAFCAGLDLKELGGESAGAAPVDRAADSTAAIAGSEVIHAMRTLGKPIIGAINGFAITGGFEVALACDLLVASSAARFADTHARVGILPGWGLSQKLSRLIGLPRAKELSLTGNYLSAEQADRWGLVNRVVDPAELLPTCLALARDMLSCVPEVLLAYRQLIDDGFAVDFADGLALETERSRAAAASLTPEAVAQRRAVVQSRGRDQSRG